VVQLQDGHLPDFVTHYYLAGREPFLNLSDLDEPGLSDVLAQLQSLRASGLKRVFGGRYMELRHLTEAHLHRLFVEGGGRPERRAPHYFVLGESPWYRGLSQDMRSVTLRIAELPTAVTSFTYPDSFTAMGFGPQFGLPHDPKPYHQRVYRMESLSGVVAEFGLPVGEADDDYTGYQHRPFEKYVEFQLWSDEPIAHLMGSA
jgi:hypothetical protein